MKDHPGGGRASVLLVSGGLFFGGPVGVGVEPGAVVGRGGVAHCWVLKDQAGSAVPLLWEGVVGWWVLLASFVCLRVCVGGGWWVCCLRSA